MKEYSERQYDIRNAAVFKKTSERWGGFSNMCGGYPLAVNGGFIRSSEALYQACRFPHLPDIQKKILSQTSPMTAKRVVEPYLEHSRKDWMEVRVLVMKWCLRVKLAQNWKTFSELLLLSGSLPIVELSNKDAFWGAKFVDNNIYVGVNALGRLLMQLREQVKVNECEKFKSVPPLEIDDFKLLGAEINLVYSDEIKPFELPKNEELGF